MTPPSLPDDAPPVAFMSSPDELDATVDEITGFITERVAVTDHEGVVADIGGDLNSAVAVMLAVRALGADRVLGLLPDEAPTASDGMTAELVAEGLQIEYEYVQVSDVIPRVEGLSSLVDETDRSECAKSNAVDRLRMVCAFYVADVMDRLVIGTETRTEGLLGTTTRFGVRQGGILPLGDLFRTEVRNLADHIGIPEGMCGAGRFTVEDALAPSFDLDPYSLDAVLLRLVDEDAGIEQTAMGLDVDAEIVRALAERHVATRHRRIPRPTPRTWDADRYDRFHEIELRFG